MSVIVCISHGDGKPYSFLKDAMEASSEVSVAMCHLTMQRSHILNYLLSSHWLPLFSFLPF